MRVAFSEILEAFEFVSMAGPGNSAFLCRETGETFYRSDDGDFDELPDDIDDAEKYLAVPDSRDLDLGTRLVMRFAREAFADHYDEVAEIISRRGAYWRFKELLAREGALDRWYAFEAAASEKALREWCALNEVQLEG